MAKVQIARIEALNPQSNAYYTVFEDTLRADTERTEREIARGDYRGPLHCVPVCIKDIYESGRTTCDSGALVAVMPPSGRTVCSAGALVTMLVEWLMFMGESAILVTLGSLAS